MTSDRSLLLATAALIEASRDCATEHEVIDAVMAVTPRDLGLQWCEIGTGAHPRPGCTRTVPLPGFDDLALMVAFESRPPERVGVDAYLTCVATLVAERLAADRATDDGSAAGAEEVKALQAEVERLQGLLHFISGIAERLAPEQR